MDTVLPFASSKPQGPSYNPNRRPISIFPHTIQILCVLSFSMTDKPHFPTECLDSMEGMDPDSDSCCHRPGGRNLIVCIDGTSNKFGAMNTNVIELYNLILKGANDNQRTWYNSGVGTYARASSNPLKSLRQTIYHSIDCAIAWDFERTVLDAYHWLSDNYEAEDCIFLFGFSRGAYQVRVLSAMIDKVGLIHKGNETQIPFAYELYADPKSYEQTATGVGSSQAQAKLSSAERFKRAFCFDDVKVHFVGAWDTVSSVGIIRKEMLPGTVDGMQHVCYFRHALALDERRVKFLPEYAYGGSAKPPATATPEVDSSSTFDSGSFESKNLTAYGSNNGANSTSQDGRSAGNEVNVTPLGKSIGKSPKVLEVWFPGTHSDIGGGNVENAGMDRSRPPLRWLVFEAGAHGLRTKRFERELSPNEQIEIKESLTWEWWPLELLFFKRLTYTRQEGGRTTTLKPHLGSGRKIHHGQKIHSSLILTNNTEYTPKAHPPDDDISFWNKARKDGLGDWLELDLYKYAQGLVRTFIEKGDPIVLQTLSQTATSTDGRQAVCQSLYPGVIGVLKDAEIAAEIKCQLLQNTVEILRQSAWELKEKHSKAIRELVSDLQTSSDISHRRTVQQFVAHCTDACMAILDGHRGFVSSVAFSPDSKQIVSGSNDTTIWKWDVETGKTLGEPFRGHTEYVMSVAFSPDGRFVVSGSFDRTVRIWDADTGSHVGEPFRGHTDLVSSVAFSPDSKRIVSSSGSDDQTVRIWDTTGNLVGAPLRRPTGRVWSVAYSPDGKYMVTGSSDKTVRIWNVVEKVSERKRLIGHADAVRSVAFSPDSKWVASGSTDHTIRIWNVKTGELVGKPLQGHTGWVNAVAFSPEGERVVSGSSDRTVGIWNAKTGEKIGELFGHTGAVTSVAFSPDGRRLASGSNDRKVRIWDVEAE